MSRFPWEEVMALGLGRLGLSPREFWAATPRELAAAVAPTVRQALPRAVLDQLLQQFPDDT